MRYVFDKDGVDPAIPGILLLSHGGFAVGCLETVRMFFGDAPNLAAFSLEEGMEPEEFAEAAFEAFKAMPAGSIVLVDFQGGTPYNQTLLFARSNPNIEVECIAGFNVPMVMQALELREEFSGRELVENLFNLNNNGVVNVSEMLDKLLKR